MKSKRPMNLNLFTIRFPIPAIASILHRASGAFLFFSIPFLLWTFQKSLNSPESFASIQDYLCCSFSKLLILLLFAALIYHIFAGIRHLVMDAGYGESLAAGRFSAKLVIVLSILATLMLGIWLW